MIALLIFIIVLSVLVIAHEFGHFLAARKSGVKVEKFAIGFGPAIFKIKGKETEFLVCAFPLGGYVKLAGDNRAELKGSPDEFLSKPAGIKMRVVFAGPLFNYILAIVLFYFVALMGFPYIDTVVGKVLDGYPAAIAGIKEKDKVISVNGIKVSNWNQMASLISKSKDKVNLELEREGVIIPLALDLTEKNLPDSLGIKTKHRVIGISAASNVKFVKYNFFQAFKKAFDAAFETAYITIKGFILMFLGVIPFKEGVAGPLGIYYLTGQAAKMGLKAILHFMAVLSVSLGVVNLFPLPLFDGGHLVIFLLEKIRRRQLKEKAENIITGIGYCLIGTLIIFIIYNDINKFGLKIWNKNKIETVVKNK